MIYNKEKKKVEYCGLNGCHVALSEINDGCACSGCMGLYCGTCDTFHNYVQTTATIADMKKRCATCKSGGDAVSVFCKYTRDFVRDIPASATCTCTGCTREFCNAECDQFKDKVRGTTNLCLQCMYQNSR